MTNTFRSLAFLSFLILGINNKAIGQDVKIDHVISVVSELEEATKEFSSLGFTIKPGRLHKNGLLNAHIKFDNYTSFEFMTVKGNPNDEMAQEYASFLEKGGGGMYLSLSGLSIESVQTILTEANIQFAVSKQKLWSYISFPKQLELSHLFFIEYHFKQSDQERYYTHDNKLNSIQSVIIEGSHMTIELLNRIGLEYCGEINDLDFGGVSCFNSETGTILVIPMKSSENRPRVRTVIFGKKHNDKSLRIDLD